MTSQQIKAALRKRHAQAGDGAWTCVEEAFSGFATWTTGGIDLLAIGVWKTARVTGLSACGQLGNVDTRNPLVAYEIKVSRNDFRRELYGYRPGAAAKATTKPVPAWPRKAQGAIERTHYFVFAVPVGLLKSYEIERRAPWGAKDRACRETSQDRLPFPGFKPPAGALYVPQGVGLVEVDDTGRVFPRVTAEPTPALPWSRHETHELMRRIDYCARRETTLTDLEDAAVA